MKQAEIVDTLPAHLRPFVKTQDYNHYTARDHAVWRFVMQHLTQQLCATAHPVYMEGLARTGISLQHIPSIEEMNDCLVQLGWRAVVVDGFIPPAIFMEFQALKVLVIALDMRSVDHVFYTPAPDIVHESAGHAPFIVDVDYAEYLQRFGEIGMQAIATQADMDVYEAIRHLSIVKACPDSNKRDIDNAEQVLQQVSEANTELSEASLLTRLHWWTVEYGLVGEVSDYRIFGAGLLSSLGESSLCLDDSKVKKLPLTVDAVNYAYDITREQPQLFVTKSCKHLSQVLEEFASAMCFKRGGASSLKKAIKAGSICTARYDTGVQVSGRISDVLCDAVGNAIYLRTSGPTQLAWGDREIYQHGTEFHAAGFGSPIGNLKDFSRCLSQYTIDELRAHNIVIGERATLEYLSGITVSGQLRQVYRQEHRNMILSFDDCTVTDLAGNTLFEPAWGAYDLAVGSNIESVYGGVADREKLQLYRPTAASETIPVEPDTTLMSLYASVARLRTSANQNTRGQLQALLDALPAYPQEWLLRSELLDVADAESGAFIRSELQDMAKNNADLQRVIHLALESA